MTSIEPRRELPNDVYLGLVSEGLAAGYPRIIWVKGYSMRPFIEHCRDKVKLVPPVAFGVGDAVLAEIAPGRYVLHRIIDLDGEKVTLQGDGNVRGEEHCRRADVRGVVAEYIRPRRTLQADDPKLRRQIRLWRRLRPIRRLLLFVYKAYV
ncbi:MAG: hypothetical protein K5945_05090 [Bacteroidaceae bacterium]|nr:hypothetical protein [Bacteroidaceae bacterium]